MSYMIAFVKFGNDEKSYPMECFRVDLYPSERVWVHLSNGNLKKGTIDSIQYLNWECKGQVLCKVGEESCEDEILGKFPSLTPIKIGLVEDKNLIQLLKNNNWIPLKPRTTTYRNIFEYVIKDKVAYILLRKNGIDIQIIEEDGVQKSQEWSEYCRSSEEGVFVRNYFAHTETNLYERILFFSIDFMKNNSVRKYLAAVGDSDKRTEKLKSMSQNSRSEKKDTSWNEIYRALGGDGEPMYLGDGMWINSSGVDHWD